MKTRISVWAGCAGLVLLASAGCSLVVDTSVPSSCSEASECAEGSECVNGSCVSPLRPACTTNTECRRAEVGEYCVNGGCIGDPVTDSCSDVWPEGALNRDTNKLLIGFIGDISEQNGPNPYGKPPLEGVRLALEEIQNENNGIPGVNGGTQRSLALLACKEVVGTDQDQPVNVARHLVEQAGVSAIIGASFSGNTLEVWDGFVREESSALLISPSATSPTITERTNESAGNDPEDRLWRTSPSDAVQTELMRLLARDLRDLLQPSKANPRLLKFVKGDAAGTGLRNSLEEGLNEDFPRLHEDSNYQNPADVMVDWEEQAARALRAPMPDIIMGLGTEEFVQEILPRIEEQWPTELARPWYVLPEGDRNDSLLSYAAEHPEFSLNARVVGTAPGARSSAYYEDFARAFRGHYGREPGNLAEFGYDAAYLLVYAIARANQQYPTALQLGEALNGLNCTDDDSVPLTPTPSDVEAQFELVANGACADFSGASGELNFDAHGEAVSDIATWCLRSRGSAFVFEPTLPQYYDAVAQERRNPLDLSAPNWCPPAP